MKLIDTVLKETNAFPQKSKKKIYKKPSLELLGDVRGITLGGTPGLGESGGRNPRHPHSPYNLPAPDPGSPEFPNF
jgi:hypothetical protein